LNANQTGWQREAWDEVFIDSGKAHFVAIGLDIENRVF
jgi:hypothetical protein